jgi:putative endonuclease
MIMDDHYRQRQGRLTERLACRHLRLHGLKLIMRNYHSPFGEIDLIMREYEVVVFVEVRSRRNRDFVDPLETIDLRKQARLRATAEHFLQRDRSLSNNPCRFDIVAVTGERCPRKYTWLRNAF